MGRKKLRQKKAAKVKAERLAAEERDRKNWERIVSMKSGLVSVEGKTSKSSKSLIPKYAFRGQDEKLPSLNTSGPMATGKAESKKYTGTAMLGVSTMHKSNSVPVFSVEDAIDIARMRRN